jgi:hypothetical protein
MLALYTEEQDKLFEHIKSVLPDGQKPVRVKALIFQEGSKADIATDLQTDGPVDICYGRLQ